MPLSRCKFCGKKVPNIYHKFHEEQQCLVKKGVREIGERKRDSSESGQTSLFGSELIKAITELRMREEGVSYYSMGWNRAVEKVLEILEGKNG